MYIAVCDDRPQELQRVEELLCRWQASHQAAVRYRTFPNADALLEEAQRERFTLYLLDVMMPGVDGMAAARAIREFDDAAQIVFLTASPEFAYESYGVHAAGYLLKPVAADALEPILDRMLEAELKPAEGLTVKSGGTYIRIPFSHLSYVEVIGKHLYFNLADGGVREVAGALKEYETALLSRKEFARIHRSYIVNMMQIETLSQGSVQTFTGKTLPVSRLLYPALQKAYMKLLFDREEM